MMLRVVAAVLIASSGLALAQEKPPAEQKEAPPEAAKPEPAKPPVLSIEKSTKPPECIIKPVMTDDELRACGARIPR